MSLVCAHSLYLYDNCDFKNVQLVLYPYFVITNKSYKNYNIASLHTVIDILTILLKQLNLYDNNILYFVKAEFPNMKTTSALMILALVVMLAISPESGDATCTAQCYSTLTNCNNLCPAYCQSKCFVANTCGADPTNCPSQTRCTCS